MGVRCFTCRMGCGASSQGPQNQLKELRTQSAAPEESAAPTRQSRLSSGRTSRTSKTGPSLRESKESKRHPKPKAITSEAEASVRRPSLERRSSCRESSSDHGIERHEKTEESLKRIRDSTIDNPLFTHLSRAEQASVLTAMFEVRATFRCCRRRRSSSCNCCSSSCDCCSSS